MSTEVSKKVEEEEIQAELDKDQKYSLDRLNARWRKGKCTLRSGRNLLVESGAPLEAGNDDVVDGNDSENDAL